LRLGPVLDLLAGLARLPDHGHDPLDQFARLEGTLSAMQRQGQALSAAMPTGGGGNLVAQLLGG
jgi:hypothetical protein